MNGKRLLILAAVLAALALSAASALGAGLGQSDPGFGSGGSVVVPGDIRLLGSAVQADGKLVVVGEAGTQAKSVKIFVGRYTVAGNPDPSFHGGSPYLGPPGTTAHGVAIQPDGGIVVVGTATDSTGSARDGILVLRLNTRGNPDSSFSGDGYAAALTDQSGEGLSVAVQPDGKIVAAGAATLGISSDGFPRVAVARFNPNGSPDNGFGQGGTTVLSLGKFSYANAIALQKDGRIVVAGSQRNDLQTTQVLVARLTTGGGLDPSFASGGLFLAQYGFGASFSAVYGVALDSQNRIDLGGTAVTSNLGGTALAIRLTPGGDPDGSFGAGGALYIPASRDPDQFTQSPLPGARSLALAGNDLILAGNYDDFGLRRAAIWAVGPGGTLDGSFGTGGGTIFIQPGNSQFDSVAVSNIGTIFASGIDNPSFMAPPAGLIAGVEGFPVPLRVKVLVRRKISLRVALRRGIPLSVACNRACVLSGQLKALGKVVARARGRLTGPGTKRLKLRFTRAGKRKLVCRGRRRACRRTVVSRLILSVRGGRAVRPVRQTRTIRLKR